MELDFRAIQPTEHLAKFLEKKIRPDGRKADGAREVVINAGSISTADGSALVRMGGTTVICGVKAELANPPADTPNVGYIVSNVELPPLCSPSISSGPPSSTAQVLSQTLQDTLLKSKCIDLMDLCISEGKLSWVLYVDLVCLSHDGNVNDAAMLAASAALNNTRLPTVDLSSEKPQVSLQQRIPLSFNTLPFSITYGFFQDHILLDPTQEEEALCSGSLSVVVLSDGLLAGVEKTGKPGLPPERLLQLCREAQVRGKLLNELVQATSKQ